MVQGQIQTQSIRPLTTAHLAQTMTLLSLAFDELGEQIEKELSENPALELLEERRCPNCKKVLPPQGKCPICSQPKDVNLEEPIVFVSPSEDFYSKEYSASKEYSDEPASPQLDDLPTYVLKQIAPELDEKDRPIAAYLLTHLDEDGLLSIQTLEVANYFHIALSEVARIQRILQLADPLGVGSCSSVEAILIQLEVLRESRPVPEHTEEVVRDHMNLLSRHLYAEIGKKLGVHSREVNEIATFISENLNPFPARSHWGDSRQASVETPSVYRQPDILISIADDGHEKRLVVEIVLPISGTLRVNPDYRQAMHEVEKETKEEMKGDMDRASLFIKCLQQRNNTMQRLMVKVVSFQKDFILRGEKELRPFTRAEVARELAVHESTISRAVSTKSVQMPNGRIIPLSKFFDRSLNVRTVLRELIANEPKPMSDSALVKQLKKHGFNVARRTVAKYRAMEGILPAHLRHSLIPNP
jgi:RNA polymerase sigma-54 factor